MYCSWMLRIGSGIDLIFYGPMMRWGIVYESIGIISDMYCNRNLWYKI